MKTDLNGQMEPTPRPFHDETTIGEKYGPATKITEQAEADRYFEACVIHNMSFGTSRERAEEVERQNLGYFAGYYDNDTRERVERLFRCAHPIFGAIAKNGAPSFETAFEAGRKLAEVVPSVPNGNDSSSASSSPKSATAVTPTKGTN